MKKILKYGFISIIAIFLLTCFIFRGRIGLYYSTIKQLSAYKNDFVSIESASLIQNITETDVAKKDVIFKSTNNTDLHLDIYTPTTVLSKGSPVILYVHGGSWAYGERAIPSVVSPMLNLFNDKGYTIISMSYELLNKNTQFDKQAADVKDAIRWIHKNKDEYNFNTDEIGVMGVSAGAHLAMLACYSDEDEFVDDASLASYPSNIKYFVDFFGPTDLNTLDTSVATKEINDSLENVPNKEEYYEKYSPINYLKEDLPKTLIVHSKADTMVPYSNSYNLYEKSKALGNKVELVTLNDMNHDLSNLSTEDTKTIAYKVLTFIINNSPL